MTPQTPLTATAWIRASMDPHHAVADFYGSPAANTIDAAIERRRAAGTSPLSPADLAEWRHWLAGSMAPDAVLAGLDRLAIPGSVCIVTGQQAGLGLGPLYTVWKALTAIHLARETEARLGVPCVPVFWVASDDHDAAEAAWLRWMDSAGAARTFRLDVPATNATPMHSFAMAEGAARLADDWISSVAATEFRPDAERLLRTSLESGATFESHFVRLLLDLLGPLGIVPVVPRLGFLRRAAASLAMRELDAPRRSATMLAETYQHIAETYGLKPLHRRGDEMNFFLEDSARVGSPRRKLEWLDDATLSIGDAGAGAPAESLSLAAVRELVRTQPEVVSPNAALRPLVQDLALPSVAYVGGPAEYVYHGQIGRLYVEFGVVRPAILARARVLLIEPRVERHLERAGIPIEEVGTLSREALESRLRQGAGGEELQVSSLGEAIERAVAGWQAGLGPDAGDAGVEGALRKLREGIATGTAKLAERLDAARTRREETATGQRARVVESLYPAGEEQERSVGVWSPLLVNHGAGVFERLLAKVRTNATDLQVIRLADVALRR